MEYQQMEQEHVSKIEQASALLNEVLAGEKKEVDMEQPKEAREEVLKALKA